MVKKKLNFLNKINFFFLAFIIVLDQVSKFLIRYFLEVGDSVPVIKDFFHITYVTNSGATWGLFSGNNFLFIIISVLVIVFFILEYRNLPEPKYIFGIILGGIFGNLIDRIFLGHVVDFIDFRFWPVFNVADSAISVGVFVFVLMYVKKEVEKR
ncbi:signal peptidase II [Candidatus Woesearchaeota archaeon]|nr:signal peptidase II [Candidatus Woesearchaeota archaeon]